jgi:hypothetical protein
MENEKKCAVPKCEGCLLIKVPMESSLTIEKYICPNCGRPYIVPTTVGKVVQVAPLALFGTLVLIASRTIFASHIDHTVDTDSSIGS